MATPWYGKMKTIETDMLRFTYAHTPITHLVVNFGF